ncbi:MAG: DNA polymerase III subunit delta [Thermoanaerobaculia bacterium]
MTTESELLKRIGAGKPPSLILVGGDSEFLVDASFHSIRDALEAIGAQVETFAAGTDLGQVLDSFRTHSLFGGTRLLILPEINAFVTRKEISTLLDKSIGDFKTAKTDRKRTSAVAKLLHVLGLAGIELDESDTAIAENLGLRKPEAAFSGLLQAARDSGKRPSRGENDAAMLAEAASEGGAPGSILLMRTGEVPVDSATVAAIVRGGAVVVRNLTREDFDAALSAAISQISEAAGAKFDPQAIRELRARLGIERILSDKFSKDVPDLRQAANEADRLATFVGEGGRITVEIVRQQVAEIGGGMRWELGSLFAEGKSLEAISKLRDLVAQAARDEGKASDDIHYGRFLFAFADEIRQLIGIHSWARMNGIDVRRGTHYNRFKDAIAEPLSEYLKSNHLVRQKPHPFALHKRFESARLHDEAALIAALDQITEIEVGRKSGGPPVDVALETFVMGRGARG